MEVIEIASAAEEAITKKSMEHDAKAFIKIVKLNIETWEKSLERGKQGKRCNFKDVSKKITELRRDIISDKDGVLGNKHALFIDIQRCSNLINHEFYNLATVIEQYMVKQFSTGLAREEAFRKVKKGLENYEDVLESIRADKKDYRWSFLLDEFDELIGMIEDLISPEKSSKGKNIFSMLDEFSDTLENVGLQIDILEDSEKRKMLMKQYTYSKELTNKFVSITKDTVGHLYGSIVTKVMSD